MSKQNIEQLENFAFKGQKAKPKTGNNAYIYYRVSSLKQEQDGKSLEWQKKICEEYCQKNGFTIIEYFGGVHESAKTDEGRKEFMRMIDSVKKGKPKINHIVVYSYDRFSRTGDTSLIKELKERGVKIHAVTQPVDDDTPSGRFFQNMHAGYAEWENAEREKKCKEGMMAKLMKGEVVTKPPIGYEKRKVPGEKPQCFINEKGVLIRQAFHWIAEENISQTEALLRLSSMGLKLSQPQISQIFRNVFYIGYIKNSLIEGKLIKGKHEPLVSEEIFMKVNGFFDDNPHGWKVNKERDEVPLKGFCKCGVCEGSMTGYLANGHWYYKCKKADCKSNVSADFLNGFFEGKLKEYKVAPALIPTITKILETTYWKLNETDLRREKPLKEEITKLKNELEVLEENLAFGRGVTKELYDKYYLKHSARIAQIEKDLEMMHHEGSKLETYINTALESADNMLKIWQLLDYRGKQRLQFLIFPDGMRYFKETKQVLIPKVNKIFSSIALLTGALSNPETADSGKEKEDISQVYLTFGSSNLFWQGLKQINEFNDYLNYAIPSAWNSLRCNYYNILTGTSESVQFTYVSDISVLEFSGTSSLKIGYSINPKILDTIYSGGTTNFKNFWN